MKIQVFKRTEDNWYGCYKIVDDARVKDLVEVSFTQTGPNPNLGDGQWRVCVWGNDDCGMERDFHTSEDEALTVFIEVIGWKFVNMNRLSANGFVSA